MDLTLSDEQRAISELAARILTDRLPAERIKEIEAGDDWFAADVWAELAKADLLGLALPEAHGGGGYGFVELALVLEAVGRATAPLPALATLVLGALPVAEHGDADQQAALLPGVIAGERHLTAALGEGSRALPPERPATVATRAAGDAGWTLTGVKTLVPAASLADRILVPARTGDATTVFLVDPAAAGVALEENRSLNGEPLFTLRLDGVAVADADVLGEVGAGAAIVARTVELATAATCAIQAGVCEAATRLTGDYASSREQFGAPIATFQAVAHRVADAYIDTEAVRLTARQAAWRLAAGEDAAEAIAVAKLWAADGAHRVVHAAQHVHGGIGVDTDYPVHRTFRWAKHHELALGHATDHLRALSRRLAAG